MSKLKGFSKKELIDIYSKIYLSRELDIKQLILLKQGKGFFHIGATGHEAAEMAAANNLKPGVDYSYPYYREQAYCIGLGMTSKELLLSFLAKNDDLRHVVRRAFVAEKFPYSEIQDNIIGHSLMPIDMLRLKLSFFGVLKFDPRSDKWLRINMFQGAPLPEELNNHNDQWIYNSLN